MAGRVEGRIAFITGAARGQGRALAVRLAEEGADIIAVDICRQIDSIEIPMATPEDLAITVKEVEQTGRRIIAAQADVRDGEALRTVVADGVAAFGRLDIVCANAGISGFGSFRRLPDQAWRDMIDVNLTGVWETCRAAVPHMLEFGNGGSIIVTSSDAGLHPVRNMPHYITAKHGVVGLMRAMALELARKSIRVNSVHPGSTDTGMVRNDVTKSLFLGRPDGSDEDFEAASQRMHAMPVPFLDPRDIANAALFLASDEARYITGITLPVDAGHLLL